MSEVRCADGRYECPHCRVWLRLPPDGAVPARCGNPICKGILVQVAPSTPARRVPGSGTGGLCLVCEEPGADQALLDGREHHARCYDRLIDLHAELDAEEGHLRQRIVDERDRLETSKTMIGFLVGVVTGVPVDREACKASLRDLLDELEETQKDKRELEETLADIHQGYRDP